MKTRLTKPAATHNLALNLRGLMDSRGLTQQQLADAAGISQPFVHQLLHEKRAPNAIDLMNIASALGVSSETLLKSHSRKMSKKIKDNR